MHRRKWTQESSKEGPDMRVIIPLSMNGRLHLRWLGVAGIELTFEDQVLIIDPFLTRPPFRSILWGRPRPDLALLARHIQHCDSILVSHPHYDHLMDVPAIAQQTGAAVYGSVNACRIASILGLPEDQVHEISSGARLKLGEFEIEVLPTEHIQTPVDRWINGPLPQDLHPPLRLRDYRMDCCFAFLIQVGGMRILFNKNHFPADVLLFAPLRAVNEYARLLQDVQPRITIPIHWDDFFCPLEKRLRPLPQPPKWLWPGLESQHPNDFKRQIEALDPKVKVHVPTLFEKISLDIFA